MAFQYYFGAYKSGPKSIHRRVYMSQSSEKESSREGIRRVPAKQFAPLASTFRRRLLVGVGSATLVAVGANFAGLTSFFLGLSPEGARNLKLDVLYPIRGYSRCIDTNEGFEFIYPASWVGDQRLLYRAAEREEYMRSLDPPPINAEKLDSRRPKNVNEPVVAFGPPGSSGELNVSVIVSPVPNDFSIEAFGGAREVGEAIIRTVTGSKQRPDLKGILIGTSSRVASVGSGGRTVRYYELEFTVESPTFKRHNVAVCCANAGRLYTLNAQSPESAWQNVKSDFRRIADSFSLIS